MRVWLARLTWRAFAFFYDRWLWRRKGSHRIITALENWYVSMVFRAHR